VNEVVFGLDYIENTVVCFVYGCNHNCCKFFRFPSNKLARWVRLSRFEYYNYGVQTARS